MDMQVKEVDGNLTQVVLAGRLDTLGVGGIETRFLEAVVPPGKPVIVDLSQVEFLASLGVHMLLSAARSLGRKGAKLALYAPQERVSEVLEAVAVSEIIPVCPDANSAIATVRPQ